MKKGLILIALPLFMVACGGGSGVGSLDKLPRMTNPVLTSGQGEVKFSSVKVDSATTGVTLWGAGPTTFSHGQARGMCEMVNMSKESLDRAAQADKVLCYIQNTIVSDVNKTAMNNSGLNIYDGNYHIVTLTFSAGTPNDGQNATPRMKIKVVKDGDKIKEFEMFMCMGGTTAAPIQSEYLHETINGEDINIVSKNVESGSYNGSPEDWKSYLTVVGKINGDSQFTQKEITAINSSYQGATSHNEQKAIFDQYSDSMTVSAYQSGQWGGQPVYTNQVYSAFQLVNGTSLDVHQLAIGDGSLKATFSSGGGVTESWTGDNKADISYASGSFYSNVSNGTNKVTTSPTAEAQAIAFSGADAWTSCSGASEASLTVNMTELDPICSALGLRHDDGSDSWIDCWTVTQ